MGTLDNVVEIADELADIEDILEVPVSRRSFLNLVVGTVGSAMASAAFPYETEAAQRRTTTRKRAAPARPRHSHYDYRFIRDAVQLGYTSIVPEPNLRSVVSFDRNPDDGRIQRCMRWKNITDAAQARYGVPSSILLGMIAQESYGDPTEPNQLGDGGLGLVHMQPGPSAEYGLDRITNSRKLRDFEQGRKILGALQKEQADLKDLVKYDDRWHPIINIDAAARIMCDHYENSGHNWNNALARYSGRPHRQYGSHVRRVANKVNSAQYMRNLARRFNALNAKTLVQGAPLTFDRYVRFFTEQNRNYGLDRYRNLPQRRVHRA